MFRKEKMKGNNNNNNNIYGEYNIYDKNNLNFYDVGSSSSSEYSTIKNNYFDDQYYNNNNNNNFNNINNVGPSPSVSQIDLVSEFQKMGLDNSIRMSNDHGHGRYGVGLDRVNLGGTRMGPCLDGYGGGFDRDYRLLGGRESPFSDSVGSFSGFSGLNCDSLGDFYGNVGLDMRGSRLYADRRMSRGRDGFFSEELPVFPRGLYKELLNPLVGSRDYGGRVLGNVGGVGGNSLGLSRRDLLFHSMRESMMASERREGSPPVALLKKVNNGRGNQTNGRRKMVLGERGFDHERNGGIGSPVGSCDSLVLESMYSSLADVQGNIYQLAKDQNGCRFLQKKFEDGSFENVQIVFNEIIDHVVELMINPFGNYLIQKLLEVCDEEQRTKIVYMIVKNQDELVRICLNTHGTRVVQKLIDSLKTRKQISFILRAIEPCFLDLIQDLNGNHVIQRCLQCLHCDDIKFIFDASTKFCVKIATHRHGCCVLQRCIAHASGEHRAMLIQEICLNGLMLAQDPFGNYVVQYIIELRIPSAAAHLMSQFEGNFVQLSMQKFSSHVVEKCLKFIEESQARIVCEFLSVPHFEQLLQDPFANYVVQSALEVTKGAVNESLAAAVRPHSTLRTNPHCKKIFTRGLIKK